MEVLAEVLIGARPRPIGTLNWLPDNAPVLCLVLPLLWLIVIETPLLLLLFLVLLLLWVVPPQKAKQAFAAGAATVESALRPTAEHPAMAPAATVRFSVWLLGFE